MGNPEGRLRRADVVRAAERAATPRIYNPWLHLATTMGLCAAAIIWGLSQLAGVRPLEWVTVPLVLLGANLFEWHIHRHVLHRKAPPLAHLYERHTPMHHAVFREDDMILRNAAEMRLVLLPAFGIAGILVLIVGLSALLSRLVGPATAGLFAATAAFYVLSYEISHLLYHVDPASRLGRLPGLAVLRRHHAVHHDPQFMQRWNFNVTIPLADRLFGTDLGRRPPQASARESSDSQRA